MLSDLKALTTHQAELHILTVQERLALAVEAPLVVVLRLLPSLAGLELLGRVVVVVPVGDMVADVALVDQAVLAVTLEMVETALSAIMEVPQLRAQAVVAVVVPIQLAQVVLHKAAVAVLACLVKAPVGPLPVLTVVKEAAAVLVELAAVSLMLAARMAAAVMQVMLPMAQSA